MILQYKGFNNNWTYEEADVITWANVWVGKETRDYRKGGCRYERKYTAEYMRGRSTEDVDLAYAKEMLESINRLIKKETNCSNDIIYHINKFDMMENVAVVILQDKNKFTTRVFEKGVYLLNNKGQTVQRIA